MRGRGQGRTKKRRRGRWSREEQARLKELFGQRDDATIARELGRSVNGVRRMAEKLFPDVERNGPWTARESQALRRYLGATSAELVARILGRSPAEVQAHIAELGHVRREGPWTHAEIRELGRIYGRRTDEDLALVFARSPEEIDRIARERGLAKDKAFLRKLGGLETTRMPRWSAAEVELLRRDHAACSNLELARALHRSVKSVVSKAHALGLKKSADRLRCMGRENIALRHRGGGDPPDAVLVPYPPDR